MNYSAGNFPGLGGLGIPENVDDTDQTNKFRWATITDLEPLTIRFDGDLIDLPISPASLVDPAVLDVSARVWCQLVGRRVVILGTSYVKTYQWHHIRRGKSSAQSFTSGAGSVAIKYDVQLEPDSGIVDVDDDGLIFEIVRAGRYAIHLHTTWTNNTATGNFTSQIIKNPATDNELLAWSRASRNDTVSRYVFVSVTTTLDLEVGDSISGQCYQDTGGDRSLYVSTSMSNRLEINELHPNAVPE